MNYILEYTIEGSEYFTYSMHKLLCLKFVLTKKKI